MRAEQRHFCRLFSFGIAENQINISAFKRAYIRNVARRRYIIIAYGVRAARHFRKKHLYIFKKTANIFRAHGGYISGALCHPLRIEREEIFKLRLTVIFGSSEQGVLVFDNLSVFYQCGKIFRIYLRYCRVYEVSSHRGLVSDDCKMLRTEEHRLEIADKFRHFLHLHPVYEQLLLQIPEGADGHFMVAPGIRKADAHLRMKPVVFNHFPVLCLAEALSAGKEINSFYNGCFSLCVAAENDIHSFHEAEREMLYVSEVFKNRAFKIHNQLSLIFIGRAR